MIDVVLGDIMTNNMRQLGFICTELIIPIMSHVIQGLLRNQFEQVLLLLLIYVSRNNSINKTAILKKITEEFLPLAILYGKHSNLKKKIDSLETNSKFNSRFTTQVEGRKVLVIKLRCVWLVWYDFILMFSFTYMYFSC